MLPVGWTGRETGERVFRAKAGATPAAAVRRALENAGVEFIDEDGAAPVMNTSFGARPGRLW
jgi:hypothetical protein